MKVTNGYIIERNWSLYEIQQFFCSIRKTIRNICIQTMKEEFALRYSLHADMLKEKLTTKTELAEKLGFANNESFSLSYKSQFGDRIAESLESKQGWYWNLYGLDIYVFSTPDGKILCITNGNKQELLNVFTSYPYVKPYDFDSNADKPKELSKEQWETRQTDWELALNNYPTHSNKMNGFLVECIDSTFASEEIVKLNIKELQMPDIPQRAKRLAETYCDIQVTNENKDKDYGEILKIKASDQYKERIKERAIYYKKNLPQTVPMFLS